MTAHKWPMSTAWLAADDAGHLSAKVHLAQLVELIADGVRVNTLRWLINGWYFGYYKNHYYWQ